MLLCNHHHMKSFEESTYTPAILSARNKKDSKSSSTNLSTEKTKSKSSYQIWMQLVQRLHDRTVALKPKTEGTTDSTERYSRSISDRTSTSTRLRREKSWAGREIISPWNNEKLNSNKQVISLINHYSSMLTIDNNEQFTQKFNNRPKSILRPIGSSHKYRFSKEVTFATN